LNTHAQWSQVCDHFPDYPMVALWARTQWSERRPHEITWARRGHEMGTEWARNKNAHMKWAFAVSGHRSLFGCAGTQPHLLHTSVRRHRPSNQKAFPATYAIARAPDRVRILRLNGDYVRRVQWAIDTPIFKAGSARHWLADTTQTSIKSSTCGALLCRCLHRLVVERRHSGASRDEHPQRAGTGPLRGSWCRGPLLLRVVRMNRASASLSRPAAPGAATDSCNGFPAVSRPDARILVLGTLPGQRSLACGEYYAHPRNQFWRIASELLGVSIDLPYEARLQHLLDRHIALWDVCAAARRPGSLDARIEAASVVPNDFAVFFAAHPEIIRVCLNGQHASKLYQRLILRTLPDHLRSAGITLPSTSPANASVPFEDKRRAWAKALL